MGEVSTIGLDIAKSVFQVHGVDVDGAVVMCARKDMRSWMLSGDHMSVIHPAESRTLRQTPAACLRRSYWTSILQAAQPAFSFAGKTLTC
jgi:hypothetical protein